MPKSEQKHVSSGVASARKMIESWIAESERKLVDAGHADAKQAQSYLSGRLDGYRDCLAILNQ